MKWRPDWFLLGMVAAVALAWQWPSPGAAGGWMHPELLTKVGVAVIFFLHGVALSFAALKAGSLRWPLHLLVQTATFLLFPLIGLAVLALLGSRVTPELRWGIFYLCALPSTVSSSVALTAAARGNVAAAVFNATLSSVLGVFLTPLWMAVVMNTTGHTLPLGPVILDLVRWLILPLVAGQLCRPLLSAWATRHKGRINRVDRATILLLVYTSFCDSFQQRIWSSHGVVTLVLVVVGAAALFALVLTLTTAAANALHFSSEDRIAAVFCGSKKSMASGVPMAKLLFGAHPGLGVILLPIMIYHPLQLALCGWLAARWAKRTD
ncbi:MAG: bile acid:sodium symporter [Opitutae bacterium]|nr:bile acid:sodium symporter [Opitutae bacterium]